MTIQKIIRVGNSAAITIPKEFLQQSGLRIGDEMALDMNPELKYIYAKPKDDKSVMTPEFKEWLDKFVEKYKPLLKKMARI